MTWLTERVDAATPLHEVLDIDRLAQLGLVEVSINMEIWNEAVARRVMPRKHKQGREHYLDYLRHAASVLGGGRVRSMLMLGLEPVESTMEGVEAIAELGCVPVLSPFRPDPSTPLRDWPVPTAFRISTRIESAEDSTFEILASWIAIVVPSRLATVPCAS